ncbi:MAG: type II toxin-antitoxin system prevent-host-death family antitoxin [Acidimicrobiales bacterium]|nr:type II toxin-antitoxin system prevent-host-death family antitoxin [Acidimicrobiales bacterium]
MDVAVTELRSNLRRWLSKAKDGDDVVITERGLPVARLVPIESASTIARLTEAGIIGAPKTSKRPRASAVRRPRVDHPLSDLVSEQRR